MCYGYRHGYIIIKPPNLLGEKIKLWSCCSQPTSEGGCTRGPHVFSESEPDELHARHAFSWTRPPSSEGDTALDVVALDCEMIYTTGGVRVARVSVVDGSGKEIFDEHVKMDDGVEVVLVPSFCIANSELKMFLQRL